LRIFAAAPRTVTTPARRHLRGAALPRAVPGNAKRTAALRAATRHAT